MTLGYGDLFVAALLGGVYATRWSLQRVVALLTLLIAAVFDLLFLAFDNLPATVPVALALIAAEVSGRFGRWRRADATPRPER